MRPDPFETGETRGMKLARFLNTILSTVLEPNFAELEVLGVTHDSRQVQPGFVFVAIPGVPLPSRPPLDGHDYIPQALERGAIAVVGTRPNLELPVPYSSVPDARAALGDLAASFWDYPAKKLEIIGVTGSKGKSTTSTLIHHLLEHAGVKAARMSTVGVRFAGRDEVLPGHFTTPESPQVQELLARFVAAGCTHAVLEVSSHALALERVRGIEYKVGVWTNLEPEHLDFHGTLEAYGNEKLKLLERSHWRVLNNEDEFARQAEFPNTYWYGDGGEWTAQNVVESPLGLEFDVQSPHGSFSVRVPMIGKFNVLNSLAAMAAFSLTDGFNAEEIRSGLESFPGVPGRMQMIQTQPFRVINDFAHTENSLRAALEAVRHTTSGRVILVVGAAGERGEERRTGLARVAAQLADVTIFTEEDHRSESLEAILETMRSEFVRSGGGEHHLVPDRRDAIQKAIQLAQPGDTVLLAGKGHERTLERTGLTLPWDESAEARIALETR
jgi:UDP-N-acetylmuramoyl-L-alanyl-D-glutamate--2,6-diaminopimelate ligase